MSIYYGKTKVSGGAGGVGQDHILLSKAEYDAMESHDPDKIYCISDDNESGGNEHVILSKAQYEALPISEKMNDKVYMISDDNDQNWNAIYRWQSDVDSLGQYSWFEIWPDGWCRQGGVKQKLVYSGEEVIELTPNIYFKKDDITFNSIPKIKPTIFVGNSDITYKYIGYTQNSLSIASNTERESAGTDCLCAIMWTAEGFRDTELCTLNDISAKYTNENGRWSSNVIGMNGSNVIGGYGGGVIDGTVLVSSDNITVTTTKENVYTVQNDCLLVGLVVKSDAAYSVEFFIGDNAIFQNDDGGMSGDTGKSSFRIPIKKGTKIKGISYISNATVTFIEYKLNSLAPQIAMPDYDKRKVIRYDLSETEASSYVKDYNGVSITFTRMMSTEILENGYVNAMSMAETGASEGSLEVNGILVDINSDSNNINGYESNMIPVSKGDIVSLYSTENDYGKRWFDFYPCKSVIQEEKQEYLTPISAYYQTSKNMSENVEFYKFTESGKYQFKFRTFVTGGAYETELKLNDKIISYISSDDHDATPTTVIVIANNNDILKFGKTFKNITPETSITSFSVNEFSVWISKIS